jgi:hypothetical protein
VVVAAPGGYDLVRNGRADAAPVARGVSPEALPALMKEFA